jgi:cytochrome P450
MSVNTRPRRPAPERPLDAVRILQDVGHELRRHDPLPPGDLSFSLPRTMRFQREPVAFLLDRYQRYGPVFTVRLLHRPMVVMLGPEANHFVTVSGAKHFSWRRGMFGENLIPVLGDGLITTDDEPHDRARRIAMPAFHMKRMDAAVAIMAEETSRALERWTPGARIDAYDWMRELAMNIAMRALLGLDPHSAGAGAELVHWFEKALAYTDQDIWKLPLRGPGTPWQRLKHARHELDRLVYAEIARRRAAGTAGEDILSMLMQAHDDDGTGFNDHELRDQVITLLFGGHDTSSSTFAFLAYELARHAEVRAAVRAESHQVLDSRAPTLTDLTDNLPQLAAALDETLRLYPPVWFGPRMAISRFELHGHHIPAGTHVMYCAWASHRLPDVFDNPSAFKPERFAPDQRAALPKGAYVPFGGGQRICIGKRFGQLVVKTVTSMALRQADWDLPAEHHLEFEKTPTLSPASGLPIQLAD